MNRSLFCLLCIWACCLTSCQSENPTSETQRELVPKQGVWKGEISLNDSVRLPFNFELFHEQESYKMVISNADERIEVTDVVVSEDSIKFILPVFANYLLVKKGEEKLIGSYVRPDADNYRLAFIALHGDSARFEVDSENCCDINEKWRVMLGAGTEDKDPAIAYFEQRGTQVTGSFLTVYGDYRYLEGVLSGDSLKLSTFDGVNLQYFEAKIVDGQQLEGLRYSGRSFMEPWLAFRDEDFQLPDADSLTRLKEGYDSLNFSFPDLSGDRVSLSGDAFKNKPVIVSIMGSWCPNCMDEARYLRKIYKEYKDDGLEIIGLTFERAKDRETAIKRAQKMKDDIGIPYPVLLAGATRDDRAADALPMLNHVMSFPTTIYLNRNHEVVRIHTGFSGPGTPVYDDFVARNRSFIEKQLIEKEPSKS